MTIIPTNTYITFPPTIIMIITVIINFPTYFILLVLLTMQSLGTQGAFPCVTVCV